LARDTDVYTKDMQILFGILVDEIDKYPFPPGEI
jgi:hypothetical protein